MPAGFHIYYQLGRLGRRGCSLGVAVPLSKKFQIVTGKRVQVSPRGLAQGYCMSVDRAG